MSRVAGHPRADRTAAGGGVAASPLVGVTVDDGRRVRLGLPVRWGAGVVPFRCARLTAADPERSSDWTDFGHSRTLLRLTKPATPEIRIFLAYLKDTLTNFRTNSIVKIQV